jgi:hypothetical protein
MDTKASTARIPLETEPPKKFIRTFESDMATLQKGGVPELAPFVRNAPPPAETVEIHEEPMASVPPPPPPPVPEERYVVPEIKPIEPPIIVPDPPTVIIHESISEKRQEPVFAVEQAPILPPEDFLKANPAETYASDFSERIKETHASPLTVLAAQQDAAPTTSKVIEQPPASPHRTLYIVLSTLLVLGGGVSVYFTYLRYRTNTEPVVIATPTVTAPMFVDERVQLAGTDYTLLQAIQGSIANPVQGSVRLLYLANATSTDNNIFLQLHLLSAPDILLRNINPLGGMAGVVSVNGEQSPFFILSVESYSDTFAGMLSWEDAMPTSLAGLFPPYPAPIVPPVATSTPLTKKTKTGTASSTIATTTPPLVQQGFHDVVISNHDARVLSSPQGQDVMVYGYWDQTTLVIARDTAAFTAILQRLATAHTQ